MHLVQEVESRYSLSRWGVSILSLYYTGPLADSLDDFVRMIWEYKLPTVVMLTRCVELAKVHH